MNAAFDADVFAQARMIAHRIVDETALKLVEGMNSDDGILLIKDIAKSLGVDKFWHPPKFRIDRDTLKNFDDRSDAKIRIAEGSIFSIDVGPIFKGHEGDYGKTFSHVVASQADQDQILQLVNASSVIWNLVATEWASQGLSGQGLYDFASNVARERGYRLNTSMSGHRLSEFPHALYGKEDLSEVSDTPRANKWVLEIHVISDELGRGSFFEDLLAD